MNPLFLLAMLYSVGEASAAPLEAIAALSDENSNTDVDVINKESQESVSAPITEATFTDQEHRALSSKKCRDDEQSFRIDITTDFYGFENSWKLLKSTSNGPKEIYSGPPANRRYDKEERYLGVYCLSPGTYKFIITDLFKDGMCCDFGQGKYAGYVGKTEVFSSPSGDENWDKRAHLFKIASGSNNDLPFNPKSGTGLTPRSQEWLVSHNRRRERWHEHYGKRYVPLNWSQALMDDAKIWAQKLANDCALSHDPDSSQGENIALNYGWGEWAEMRPTDNILSRFVEDEADEQYPDNGHFTQVLWRATKYVGCADASSPYDGGTCHAQVCRYTRPGNCNMSRYESNKRDWWLTPMLMPQSPCGEECPPDGCI